MQTVRFKLRKRVCLITAEEMTWQLHDEQSPVELTPNRSPSVSSVGGCGGGGVEGDALSSMSPEHDQASSPCGSVTVTQVGDCPRSAVVAAAAQLTAASCLRSVSSAMATATDDSPLLAAVQCRLETKELWDKFYELGTEMIITKSGRSPRISVSLVYDSSIAHRQIDKE